MMDDNSSFSSTTTSPSSSSSSSSTSSTSTNSTPSTAMDVDLPTSLLASPAQSTSTPATSLASPTTPSSSALSNDAFIQAVAKVKKENKDATAASAALKQIAKLLQSATRNPADKKNRMLLLANIVIKKYVSGLAGGLELMKVCGFHEEVVDKKAYLVAGEAELRENQKLIDSIALELTNGYPYSGPNIDSATTSLSTSSSSAVDDKKVSVPAGPPQRCKGGCGFYGDPSKGGLCSVCFKKQTIDTISSSLKPNGTTTTTTGSGSESEKKEGSGIGATLTGLSTSKKFNVAVRIVWAVKRWRRKIVRQPQTNKERCWKCNRKIGFSGYECRCGYIYCSLHRYAHEHDCRVDHTRRYKEQLSRNNQKVAPSQQLGEL